MRCSDDLGGVFSMHRFGSCPDEGISVRCLLMMMVCDGKQSSVHETVFFFGCFGYYFRQWSYLVSVNPWLVYNSDFAAQYCLMDGSNYAWGNGGAKGGVGIYIPICRRQLVLSWLDWCRSSLVRFVVMPHGGGISMFGQQCWMNFSVTLEGVCICLIWIWKV